ncbi:exodeoxyribonuclease VII small subunit [bacterium]|nr:exodeoxyribonuclease VII small subunit [bacterium]
MSEKKETKQTKMSFEDALDKLQKIVEKIEEGELSLNECLAEYEEGIKLATFCSQELKAAKAKVEKLQKENDGAVEALECEISAARSEE